MFFLEYLHKFENLIIEKLGMTSGFIWRVDFNQKPGAKNLGATYTFF
jgi:hypothetical protein